MITLYTTGCPRCQVLEKKLNAANIDYSTFVNIEEMLDMGITNVPILEIDDNKMDFKTAVDWINERIANEY